MIHAKKVWHFCGSPTMIKPMDIVGFSHPQLGLSLSLMRHMVLDNPVLEKHNFRSCPCENWHPPSSQTWQGIPAEMVIYFNGKIISKNEGWNSGLTRSLVISMGKTFEEWRIFHCRLRSQLPRSQAPASLRVGRGLRRAARRRGARRLGGAERHRAAAEQREDARAQAVHVQGERGVPFRIPGWFKAGLMWILLVIYEDFMGFYGI
jgi:hypothetical protein